MNNIQNINSYVDTSKNRWVVLFTVAATTLLVIMDSSITNLSLPALTRVFDTETSVVLWVTAVYSLVSAGFTPIFGRLGDLYGRKKLFIMGFVLYTVGLGLCAISQGIVQLIISRAIQGVGGAAAIVLSMAIVTAVFPDRERGRAMGIMAACQLVGPLLGSTLGGILLDVMGWRSIFYLRLPLCLIVVIMSWLLLKEQKENNGNNKVDYWGAAILVSGISCLVLYFNLGGRISFYEPAILALAAVSLVLMVAFVLKARKDDNAIVDLSLFKNRLFNIGIFNIFLHALSLALRSLVIPYYLIDGRGFSSTTAGLLMAVASTFIIAVSPISGWLSDKVGYRLLCPLGMGLACISTIMLSRLNADSTFIQIIIPQAIFGIGDAVFISPITSMFMGAAPRNKLGVASAMMTTVRTVAMAAGVVISGVIFTNRGAFYAAEMAGSGLDEAMISRLSLIGGFSDTLMMGVIVLAIGVLSMIIGIRKQSGGIPAEEKG